MSSYKAFLLQYWCLDFTGVAHVMHSIVGDDLWKVIQSSKHSAIDPFQTKSTTGISGFVAGHSYIVITPDTTYLRQGKETRSLNT